MVFHNGMHFSVGEKNNKQKWNKRLVFEQIVSICFARKEKSK